MCQNTRNEVALLGSAGLPFWAQEPTQKPVLNCPFDRLTGDIQATWWSESKREALAERGYPWLDKSPVTVQ